MFVGFLACTRVVQGFRVSRDFSTGFCKGVSKVLIRVSKVSVILPVFTSRGLGFAGF